MKSAGAPPSLECEDFLRALHPRLVGGLTLHCGDAAVAEEMAQEALARVWTRWPTVRVHAAPEAWAWRVALNLSTSWFRRRAAERRANAKVGHPPDELPVLPGQVRDHDRGLRAAAQHPSRGDVRVISE